VSAPARPRREPRWTDRQVDQVIGRVLQVGVITAAAVLLLGMVMLVATHHDLVVDLRAFRGEQLELRTLTSILRSAMQLDAAAIIQLGIVLLIATPVTRVALTLVAFIIQRDRVYVALSAVVLAILLYGIVWGRA